MAKESDHLNVIMNHLHDAHSIVRHGSDKFAEYCYTHFGRPICACGQCQKLVSLHCRRMEYNLLANDCPNKQRFKNVSCPEYYLFRGVNVDDTIIAISERARKIAKKSLTAAHVDKLSRINRGSDNPSSLESIIARTKKTESQIRTELSEKTSGSQNGFFGKKHKPETLRRIAISSSKNAKYVSKPELVVYGMLCGCAIEFDYQSPIDRYVVDFKIDSFVIEVFGDYWHGGKFKPSQRKNDQHKIEVLKELGFKVLVLWESDIFNNSRKIVQDIKCFLKK